MGRIASDIKVVEVETASILTEEQKNMQTKKNNEVVGPARGVGSNIKKHVPRKRLKSMYRRSGRRVTFREYAVTTAKSGDIDAQKWLGNKGLSRQVG